MRKVVVFLTFFCITGFCFAADVVADPAEGYWLSIDDKTNKITAGWQIYQENGRLLGKIISMADHPKTVLADRCKDTYPGFPLAGKLSQMPVAGPPWIFGLSQDKPGEWSGGSIINPEDGKIYKCKIMYRAADGKKYKADVLEVRGEIGLGLGSSQFWQKSDQQTVSSLGPGR